jgi:hypothetical protein
VSGEEPSDNGIQDSLQDTLAEHRDCMRVVSEVESILDHQPDREGEWIGRLNAKLPTLAQAMREPFAAEEQGALFRELPVKKPRLATRVETLGAEHARMLKAVEDAVVKAQGLREPELYELRELNALVQLLIATIRRHEAEENEIIMGAYWDEIGAAD